MPAELVLAVLAAAAEQGQRQHLALRLAAISGARQAELAAVRWDDRHGEQLRIDSQVQTVDGVRVDRLTKSVSSARVVTMDPKTLQLWDELEDRRARHAKAPPAKPQRREPRLTV